MPKTNVSKPRPSQNVRSLHSFISAINSSQTSVCKTGSMSSAKYKLSLWLGNTYHDTVVINWLLSFCHMSLFTTVTTKRAEPGIAPAEHTYSAFYSLSYFNRCSDLCRFRLLLRLCNSLKLFHSFFTKEYEKQNQLIRYYEAIF